MWSVLFTAGLALFSLPAYIAALLGMPRVGVKALLCLGWRAAVAAAPWLRVSADGLEGLRRSEKPLVLLANHCSYMDSILLAQLPWAFLRRNTIVVGDFGWHLPLLGRVCRAAGFLHAGEAAELQLCLETHLRSGGTATWFPEGRLSWEPEKLQLFRAGGFLPLLRVDCEVWLLAHAGSDQAWPRCSALGGRPASIHLSCRRLCASSAALASASLQPAVYERGRCVWLASVAQATLQTQLSAICS